jgi:hypothetical protein
MPATGFRSVAIRSELRDRLQALSLELSARAGRRVIPSDVIGAALEVAVSEDHRSEFLTRIGVPVDRLDNLDTRPK